MRIWRNLSIGIGSTTWTALIGMAVVPLYIHYLGVEAYGLVGFFISLQVMSQLLDMGLAPTISREVARCQARSVLPEARNLLFTLSIFYWIVAALIALMMLAAASWVGNDWLRPTALSRQTTVEAVALMGLIIAVRFPVGLYTGALQGAQRLAEASALGAAMSTIGAIGSIGILALVSPTIQAFFIWQVGVAAAHLIIARWGAWRILGGRALASFEWAWLRRIGRFAAAMSVVSVLGVFLAQLDKLILSHQVGLSELGRYTLAGIPARSLGLLTIPIFGVIYARFAALEATNDIAGIETLYKNGTRLFLTFLLPLAAFIGLFASDIIHMWTGNPVLARQVALPAQLLVYGSALNSIMIFPFALQLALGNSRLPALITLVLIVGFVPLLLVLIARFGIAGAAASWLILNATYVPFGTWLTHRTMLRGVGGAWLFNDVGIPFVVTILIVGGGSLLADLAGSPLARVLLGAGLIPIAFAVIVGVSPTILPRRFASRFFGKTFRKYV